MGSVDQPKRWNVRSGGSRGSQSPTVTIRQWRQVFMGFVASQVSESFWSLFPTREEYRALGLSANPFPVDQMAEERIALFHTWAATRNAGTLADFVRSWQSRFHLMDVWCAGVAFATILRDWPGPPLPPDDGIPMMGIFEVPPPVHEIHGARGGVISGQYRIEGTWVPWVQSRADVEARAIAALKTQLDHIEAVYHWETFEPAPARNPWHFDWLGMYQVQAMPYQHIARLTETSRQRVTSGVKGAAGVIGLTLRPPDAGGRPAGIPEVKRRRRAP